VTADFVEREMQRADEAQRSRVVMLGQRQLWRLGGELLAAMEGLAWTTEDLRRAAAATDPGRVAATPAAVAELLSTIQCIVVDSLNPALESLIAAGRPIWTEEELPANGDG
jgi:hypothetical protein